LSMSTIDAAACGKALTRTEADGSDESALDSHKPGSSAPPQSLLTPLTSRGILGNDSTEWPTVLWLVRHGESAGNLARDKAHAAGISRIDIAERDVDVPLSPRGKEQSRALGAWFAGLAPQQQPEVVLVSPYRRAQATAEIIQGLCAPSDKKSLIVD
jgi:probable phosphoglycerate mutase